MVALAQLARRVRRRRRVDRVALPRAGRGRVQTRGPVAARGRQGTVADGVAAAEAPLRDGVLLRLRLGGALRPPGVVRGGRRPHAFEGGGRRRRHRGGGLRRSYRERALRGCGRRPRVFSALILATCAADLVLPWVIRHASALYVYGAVVGTTAGGIIALTTPMARTCLTDTAGLPQASGAVYSSMAPGVVAGPVLVGLVRDQIGSYARGFRGAACCWAVAFALCLTLPRQPARPGS